MPTRARASLRQRRLAEGLGLSGDRGAVLAWRDSLTGLEYLRRASDLLDRGLTLDLHAYQCHVFLDWRELRPTAEQPWDRLCDWLNGRGVPNLEDALVNLELRPVHDALRQLLDPGMVRLLADLAEHPRAVAPEGVRKPERQRSRVPERCMGALRSVSARGPGCLRVRVCVRGQPGGRQASQRNQRPLAGDFSRRLRAAMRMPQVEALFPAPWTAAARRVLPSPSPQFTATAMWGPVLGWCVLELLAESIDPVEPERAALDLFDRLRLREPFANAFAALGFEGEEAWRVAARIKVLLLTGAGVGAPQEAAPRPESKAPAAESAAPQPAAPAPAHPREEKVVLAPALWLDPDVRWLCGVHESEGHFYLICELYEELLWWLLMPALLNLAGQDDLVGQEVPSRDMVKELSNTVEAALASAKAAGYRIDSLVGALRGPVAASSAGKSPAPEAKSGHQKKPAGKPKP